MTIRQPRDQTAQLNEARTMDVEAKLNAEFDAWFAKLQALTSDALDQEDWTERWFDGYTPEDALAAGPESDEGCI